MIFNSKLIADYIELTTPHLDHIPVEHLDDFHIVREALLSVVEPEILHYVPEGLKGRIGNIKEIIDTPEMYVDPAISAVHQEAHNHFKQIILEQVTRKIQEFDGLKTIEEKQRYIAEQKQQREQVKDDKKKMEGHVPPADGSEAHTLPSNCVVARWNQDGNLYRVDLNFITDEELEEYDILPPPERVFEGAIPAGLHTHEPLLEDVRGPPLALRITRLPSRRFFPPITNPLAEAIIRSMARFSASDFDRLAEGRSHIYNHITPKQTHTPPSPTSDAAWQESDSIGEDTSLSEVVTGIEDFLFGK